MNSADAQILLQTYLPDWRNNRTRVEKVERWYSGRLNPSDKPSMPKKPTREYRDLRDRSMTPWLRLVVGTLVQALYVVGYRRPQDPDNASGWDSWQANGLDARQISVHRSAVKHALSFVSVLPGDPFPTIRGISARDMIALYQNPVEDEWPMYAVRGETIFDDQGKQKMRFRLYDEEAIYTFDSSDAGGSILTYVTTETHDAGVCPIVRFANQLELEGRCEGEVEPYIDMAARIDQDTFDRMVVQRFGSWLVRYIAGMAPPETDAEKRAEKIRLSIEDILVAEDADTKFGTLPATPLDGYISARDADIRDLAAISQTPPQDLLGQMVNLSAEALAAAEAGRTRKLEERKASFGESWEQVLRMAAHLSGDAEGAGDFEAEVVWRDMESRSLAQAADALGKLATMLGVPPELLWEKIPGFTQQDVERAKDIKEQGDSLNGLIAQLAGNMNGHGSPNGAPGAGVPANAGA